MVLTGFVSCGVSRLARFNVTAEKLSAGSDKVKYFEGTPIPTTLVLVALVALAASKGAVGPGLLPGGSLTLGTWVLHPFVLLFAVSGALMISRVHVPKW